MTRGTDYPTHGPGAPLYGPESAEPPVPGTEERPGGLNGPQTGAQSLAVSLCAPRRVQRTRKAGQPGMPDGAKYVGRGTRYGNPWRVVRDFRITRDDLGPYVLDPEGHVWCEVESVAEGRRIAADEFERWIRQPEQAALLAAARAELAGRDLACWCKTEDPCHADVLLELSNASR